MFSFRKQSPPDSVAAVDLGSNSFHMIVARVDDGKIMVKDRMREMVRLGAGLDPQGNLVKEVRDRALACLERFGQRLGHLPPDAVRAVGTNTLRNLADSVDFIEAAESALGHTVEVISGVEEARLIYLGVAHSIADDGEPRLVVDIGGGSTELITGVRFEPRNLESLEMGCVSMSRRFFPDGSITKKKMKKAGLHARMELEPVEARFRELGWSQAVGASGTIRAIDSVLRQSGWSREGINLTGLRQLVDRLVELGHTDKLALPGLDPERAPVFPGGVAILLALFEGLGIEAMSVSGGALREGLMYDLIGRIRHEDVRGVTVESMARRYDAVSEHGEKVAATARFMLEQVAKTWTLDPGAVGQLLYWAARLHEIGLAVAHSRYHRHGAYIVENADMPGFSWQEQRLLAFLIRAHRRKFPISLAQERFGRRSVPVIRLAVLLRLAVVLNRARAGSRIPRFSLQAEDTVLTLEFPGGWLDEHPLTRTDLEQEAEFLQAVPLQLVFS